MFSSGKFEDQSLLYIYIYIFGSSLTIDNALFSSLFFCFSEKKFILFFWEVPLLLYPHSLHSNPPLYVPRHSSGYLFHQNSVESGRRGYQLCSNYLGVISTLMQSIKLLQDIQCGGKKYILQETSSLLTDAAREGQIVLLSDANRCPFGCSSYSLSDCFQRWILGKPLSWPLPVLKKLCLRPLSYEALASSLIPKNSQSSLHTPTRLKPHFPKPIPLKKWGILLSCSYSS